MEFLDQSHATNSRKVYLRFQTNGTRCILHKTSQCRIGSIPTPRVSYLRILAWLGAEKLVDEGSWRGLRMARAASRFLELELGSKKEEHIRASGAAILVGVCTGRRRRWQIGRIRTRLAQTRPGSGEGSTGLPGVCATAPLPRVEGWERGEERGESSGAWGKKVEHVMRNRDGDDSIRQIFAHQFVPSLESKFSTQIHPLPRDPISSRPVLPSKHSLTSTFDQAKKDKRYSFWNLWMKHCYLPF